MQALKFRVGHTIRRDSIHIDKLSFAAVLCVFQELFNRPLQNETLRYRDDESEWIDMSTDRELQEALRLNKDKTLELTTIRTSHREGCARPNSGSARVRGSWGFRNEDHPRRGEPIHHRQHKEEPSSDYFNRPSRFRHHAICDNCNTQIVGIRHKCNECLDYDLCSECIDKSDQVHPGHTYTALARSFPRWHHRRPERQETKEVTKQEEPSVQANDDNVPATEPESVDQQENNENKEDTVSHIEPQILAEEPSAPSVEVPAQPLNGAIIREALQTLAAMGFEDKQKNVRLILAHAGDLDQILEHLLAD